MGDLCDHQINFFAQLANSREEGLDVLGLEAQLRIFKYMYLTAVGISAEMLKQASIQFNNDLKQYGYLTQVYKMPQKDVFFEVFVPYPGSL